MNKIIKSRRLDIDLNYPPKFIPALTTKKRLVFIIGGRCSAKSVSVAQLMLVKALNGADILCGREYQNSIQESVYKLLASTARNMLIPGLIITEKKIRIANGGGSFAFRGFARNPEAVRSATNFNDCWIEEAQDMSEESIDILLPTIRAPGSQIFFTANPQASTEPFSKKFIVPFKKYLDRDGFYEDAMRLILVLNWRDNPWHGELEGERRDAKRTMSAAKYAWIWEGEFNDSVEDAIIPAEWFDSAVDAHIKLNIKPQGAQIVAHDPSDTGPDPKAICYRHGIVILDAQEREIGDVNEGCDWALDYACQVNADYFVWDGDGMGISLKRQVNNALEGKKIEPVMFRGSESPEYPNAIYEPVEMISSGKDKSNAETFYNRRAQSYWNLRDRFCKTHMAIKRKEYINPDELISISSKIKCLATLRSEVCRVPLKASGTGRIQILSKPEMKTRLKIDSPNLADSLMMSMFIPKPVRRTVADCDITIPERAGLRYDARDKYNRGGRGF